MAITTIIVGCDLSAGSDVALDRAMQLAEQHAAKLVLVHAQADDAPIEHVDNEMLKQLGEVSAAVRVVEARELAGRLATIAKRGIAADDDRGDELCLLPFTPRWSCACCSIL